MAGNNEVIAKEEISVADTAINNTCN